MDSPAAIFIGLILSLVISSFVIASVVYEKEGVQSEFISPLGDMPANKELNFTTNKTGTGQEGFNWYVLFDPPGSWVYEEDVGYVSVKQPSKECELKLMSLLPDGTTYNNIYYINDTDENPFQVIVKHEVVPTNNIFIWFETNRIRIPNNLDPFNILSDIEYSYPGLLALHNFKIETHYDLYNDTLSLYVNDNQIWNTVSVNPGDWFGSNPPSSTYLGGIRTEYSGLVISSAQANQNPPAPDSATAILSIWNMALLVLIWNIPGVELWVNFLFVKTQVIGIIISGLTILRG